MIKKENYKAFLESFIEKIMEKNASFQNQLVNPLYYNPKLLFEVLHVETSRKSGDSLTSFCHLMKSKALTTMITMIDMNPRFFFFSQTLFCHHH